MSSIMHLNSGVMIMNVSGYTKSYPEFERYISYYASTRNSDLTKTSDQGLLKHFYPVKPPGWISFYVPYLVLNHYSYFASIYSKYHSTMLPKTFEWEPYLGVNDEAIIIHFHGPKFDIEGCNDINVSTSYAEDTLYDMMNLERHDVKLRNIINFEGLRHYGRIFIDYGNIVCSG